MFTRFECSFIALGQDQLCIDVVLDVLRKSHLLSARVLLSLGTNDKRWPDALPVDMLRQIRYFYSFRV